MKQFLLCLAMLICTIFMYALVCLLEDKNLTQNFLNFSEGNTLEYGVFQK